MKKEIAKINIIDANDDIVSEFECEVNICELNDDFLGAYAFVTKERVLSLKDDSVKTIVLVTDKRCEVDLVGFSEDADRPVVTFVLKK